NRSIGSGPRTPRGLSTSWLGPAPNPSIEMAKLWTRSLGSADTRIPIRSRPAPPPRPCPSGSDGERSRASTPAGRTEGRQRSRGEGGPEHTDPAHDERE